MFQAVLEVSRNLLLFALVRFLLRFWKISGNFEFGFNVLFKFLFAQEAAKVGQVGRSLRKQVGSRFCTQNDVLCCLTSTLRIYAAVTFEKLLKNPVALFAS